MADEALPGVIGANTRAVEQHLRREVDETADAGAGVGELPRPRLGDELVRDHPARAGAVVDDELLAEAFVELGGDSARDHVDGTAGGKLDHEADRAFWIIGGVDATKDPSGDRKREPELSSKKSTRHHAASRDRPPAVAAQCTPFLVARPRCVQPDVIGPRTVAPGARTSAAVVDPFREHGASVDRVWPILDTVAACVPGEPQGSDAADHRSTTCEIQRHAARDNMPRALACADAGLRGVACSDRFRDVDEVPRDHGRDVLAIRAG